MSKRSLASIVLPGPLLVLVAFSTHASRASAQSGPSITATPASAADTYLVVGAGFVPAATIKVIEVTCGPLPCGAGGGGVTVTTPDANGRFSVTLTLSNIVPTDRNYRVIAAIPDDRGGLASDPQVQVPLHHFGLGSAAVDGSTPKAPATGDSNGTTDALPIGPILLAALGLVAASASILGLTAARRR